MSDGVDLNVSIVLLAPDLGQSRERKEQRGGRKRRKTGGTARKNDEVLSISELKSVSDTLRRMYKPFPFLSPPFFNLFPWLFLSYIPFFCPTNGLIARLIEHGIRNEDHTLDGE